MNAKCRNCDSLFHHADRNEDGAPEIPDTQKCAGEDCEVYLCPKGCQHLSFRCDGCDGRFCEVHAAFRIGPVLYCGTCFREVVLANNMNEYELPEVA